jgi:hypothetical protein
MKLRTLIFFCCALTGCDAVTSVIAPTSLTAFKSACAESVETPIAEAVASLKSRGGEEPDLSGTVHFAEKEGEWRAPYCRLHLNLEFRVKGSSVDGGASEPAFNEACGTVSGLDVHEAVAVLKKVGGGEAQVPAGVRVHHGPSENPGTPGGDDWSSHYCELTMNGHRNVVRAKMGVSSFF